MSSEKADKKITEDLGPVPDEVKPIQEALKALKTISADSSFKPESFDLSKLLENRPTDRRQKFSENLSRWPEPIQDYFKRELLDYVRSKNEFPQEDLENINGFLESALLEPAACPPGKFSQKQLIDAMKSIAHELRRYYGIPDDYVEFPCWRRG